MTVRSRASRNVTVTAAVIVASSLLLGAAPAQALVLQAPAMTTPDAPTDPYVDEPTESGTETPTGPTSSESPTPTAPDTGAPTEPTTPPTSTPTGTPTPTASPSPNRDVDLGGVDFINADDVAQVAHDPAAQAALGSQIEAQLRLIDDALKAAQAKVDAAGVTWNDAHEKAEQARSDVLDLEQQIQDLRDSVELSDEQVASMVQRMRQGTYVVPPEVELFLNINPEDDLLYQYGMVSTLAVGETHLSESAKATIVEIDTLLDQAEVKKDDAEQLEAEALIAKDEAIAAQSTLAQQVELAETNHTALEALLKDLGFEVPKDSYTTELLAARDALRGTTPGSVNAQGYAVPLPNTHITSPYGFRIHPITGEHRMHFGVDFAGADTCGATLYAVAAGTITYSGWMGGYGNVVEITMADGTMLFYAHIQEGGLGVAVGENVVAGQPIALAGTTGPSTGCHLHFEVHIGGQPVEPMAWLTSRGL